MSTPETASALPAARRCACCDAAFPLPEGPDRCPYCGDDRLGEVTLAETGEVVSSTVVRVAPPGADVPYTLAYADFAPGARLFARVRGGAAPIGTPVRLVAAPEPDHYIFEVEEHHP
ncbi:putative OB-fold protein [Thermocatellispora tengchongensis]|uniref:Putative OB-fold protein n=1 Tax=Thermocatellispora tengchongensis TaxID=1073253 RepID=A0A840PIT3_9ACTN|nr:OB-fold domain-containing protein [Thermocatellispora tengchongensis]MBB5137823.1 putative OB-fold protein [Thermocatellispora tengchongensis]